MKSTYNFFPDHCPEEPKQKWGKRLNTHFRRESPPKKKLRHISVVQMSATTPQRGHSSCMLLWCWRRLLRVPWTARRSNLSILKEISPVCSLEGLMLNLKLQYFGHTCEELNHWKRPWCWERLRAGGEGGSRGWDGWMASPTQWTWVWAHSRR